MLPFKPSISLSIVLLPLLGTLLRVQPSQAQSITTDTNGTQTIVTADGNRYDISGGNLSGDGANLFHSFEQFGLSQGEIANFLGNPNIQNILGRVVGGDPSVINGLIQVSNSNANLYLMNPAGVVFGPDATLNVPADFMVTTANSIGIGEGWFDAVGENDYASLVGNPQELLFSTDQPGSIVNAGNLAVGDGQNLSLIGGTVVNTGTLTAGDTEGGNVTVAAVPGQRRVRISHPEMLLSLELHQVESASSELASAVSLSELLTGGDVTVATGVEVDESGRTWLLNTSVNTGDVASSGAISGEQVQLAAANRVTVVGDSEKLITTHNGDHSAPIVTRFSSDGTNATELVFLDTTVPDYTRLLFGAADATTTVAIPISENGIERVTEVLRQVDAVDAVHIVSEGDEGEFWLGNAYVSNETLEQYKAQLQEWGGLLSAEADILIYACLAARGVEGLSLLNEIAGLTGADVAGSIDLTGAAARGGDWVLERTVGTIEAGSAFETVVLDEYDGLLRTFTSTTVAELIADITTANGNNEADTIKLTPGGTYTLTAPNNGVNGLPVIAADGGNSLTIESVGAQATITRDGGAPNFRIIEVAGGAELTLNNIAVTEGNINRADYGGGIYNNGTLTLTNSTVSGNSAGDYGGGIYNNGALALTGSTVSGNSSVQYGGGIHNVGMATLTNSTVSNNQTTLGGGIYNGGTATLIDSTISGNLALSGGGILDFGGTSLTLVGSTVSGNTVTNDGGGIYNEGGIVTLINSTVSGNQANNNGGGIYNFNTITLINSTVSDNQANNNGGGIYNYNGVFSLLTITNSIVAGNTAPTDPEISGVFTDGGNNITMDDPMLGPLQNNGGLTQTHALLADSPAINAGNDAAATAAGATMDQRGFPREGTVDIGAFEFQTPSPPPSFTSQIMFVVNISPPDDATLLAFQNALQNSPTLAGVGINSLVNKVEKAIKSASVSILNVQSQPQNGGRNRSQVAGGEMQNDEQSGYSNARAGSNAWGAEVGEENDNQGYGGQSGSQSFEDNIYNGMGNGGRGSISIEERREERVDEDSGEREERGRRDDRNGQQRGRNDGASESSERGDRGGQSESQNRGSGQGNRRQSDDQSRQSGEGNGDSIQPSTGENQRDNERQRNGQRAQNVERSNSRDRNQDSDRELNEVTNEDGVLEDGGQGDPQSFDEDMQNGMGNRDSGQRSMDEEQVEEVRDEDGELEDEDQSRPQNAESASNSIQIELLFGLDEELTNEELADRINADEELTEEQKEALIARLEELSERHGGTNESVDLEDEGQSDLQRLEDDMGNGMAGQMHMDEEQVDDEDGELEDEGQSRPQDNDNDEQNDDSASNFFQSGLVGLLSELDEELKEELAGLFAEASEELQEEFKEELAQLLNEVGEERTEEFKEELVVRLEELAERIEAELEEENLEEIEDEEAGDEEEIENSFRPSRLRRGRSPGRGRLW